MSLRRTLLTVVLASAALLSSACLRPRYKELVQVNPADIAPGQVVVLRLVNPDTDQPLKGVRVLAGENRERVSLVTDAAGIVKLPVTRALLDENPIIEVVLPKGVRTYRVQLVPYGQAPSPEAAPAAPATPEAPAAPAQPETPAQPATEPGAMGGTDAGT
jgi:type IV pilus biogenesis protein CpaD/CtpE